MHYSLSHKYYFGALEFTLHKLKFGRNIFFTSLKVQQIQSKEAFLKASIVEDEENIYILRDEWEKEKERERKMLKDEMSNWLQLQLFLGVFLLKMSLPDATVLFGLWVYETL